MQLWRLGSPRSAVGNLETQESRGCKFRSEFAGLRTGRAHGVSSSLSLSLMAGED